MNTFDLACTKEASMLLQRGTRLARAKSTMPSCYRVLPCEPRATLQVSIDWSINFSVQVQGWCAVFALLQFWDVCQMATSGLVPSLFVNLDVVTKLTTLVPEMVGARGCCQYCHICRQGQCQHMHILLRTFSRQSDSALRAPKNGHHIPHG